MIYLNYLVRKKRVPLTPTEIKKIVKLVVSGSLVVGVVFVDDQEIKRLNRAYFRKNRATDVIAFPMQEKKILGDVVISVDTAEKNARRYKVTLRNELIRLVVHGTLHLLGYHDMNIKNKENYYYERLTRNREFHSQVPSLKRGLYAA